MKRLFGFILCFLPFLSSGQKISVDNDIVSVDGQPSFKIEKTGTLAHQSFVVSNLDGDELVKFDASEEKNENGTGKFNVTFVGREENALCNMTVGFKKIMAKKLVQMEVIANGQLTDDGVRRFCKANPASSLPGSGSNKVADGQDYSIVERNTTAAIFISNGNIKQDFKVIGTFKKSAEMISNQPGSIVRFYISDVMIAEARYRNFSANCSLTLFKNNRKINLEVPQNGTDNMKVEAMVKYLVERGYL